MVLYPQVQAKAQAEIDTVVGLTRLPTFEDRPSLPYIEAILREMLRWMPTLPLGMYHHSNSLFWFTLVVQRSRMLRQMMIYSKGTLYQRVCVRNSITFTDVSHWL
jgi:cytochrome P450